MSCSEVAPSSFSVTYGKRQLDNWFSCNCIQFWVHRKKANLDWMYFNLNSLLFWLRNSSRRYIITITTECHSRVIPAYEPIEYRDHKSINLAFNKHEETELLYSRFRVLLPRETQHSIFQYRTIWGRDAHFGWLLHMQSGNAMLTNAIIAIQ